VAHTGVLFLLLSIFLQVDGLYAAFFVDQMSVYTGLLFFGLLYTPAEMLISIPMQMLSRAHEFEADRFAIGTTGKAPAFIDALKKLAANNLANLTPHPWYVFLYYSHPPMLKRIRAIREAASTPAEPDPVSA
jgi:STE24 endopeptidase